MLNRMSGRYGLDLLEKRQISCPYGNSNPQPYVCVCVCMYVFDNTYHVGKRGHIWWWLKLHGIVAWLLAMIEVLCSERPVCARLYECAGWTLCSNQSGTWLGWRLLLSADRSVIIIIISSSSIHPINPSEGRAFVSRRKVTTAGGTLSSASSHVTVPLHSHTHSVS